MNELPEESVTSRFGLNKVSGGNSLDFLLKFNLFLIFIVLAVGGFIILRERGVGDKGAADVEVKEEIPAQIVLPENEKVTEKLTVLFGGDLMMDRSIRLIAEKKSYDFIIEDISPVLKDADLVVANLEGPITEYDSVSATSEIGSRNNYIFTMDAKVAEAMNRNNIKLVNLGNNHILNFGNEGLMYTQSTLTANDIDFFGYSGVEREDLTSTYIILEQKGVRIGFVNYNQFTEKGLERAISEIKKVRPESDYLVLYAHWGVEYADIISQGQRDIAYSFIDAGADVVIGAHPHVVQESEIYSGKKIFYSLGNFVFDQYLVPETQRGLMVEMVIDPENMRAEFTEYMLVLTPDGRTLLQTDSL